MKKSFLYGVVLLTIIAIISLFEVSLFLKVTAVISAATIGVSGILTGAFLRRTRNIQSVTPEDTRTDRKIGLNIAAFGLPFIVTTIITALMIY